MSDQLSTSDADGTNRPTVSGVVAESVARVWRDPMLVVPFAVASAVLAGIDWLRLHDPIPTRLVESLSSGTVSVTFHIYPTGAQQTGLPLGSLVDLKLPYLAWAVGLELAGLLAVGIAGWYTLARAANLKLSVGALGSYLGFVVAVQAAFRLLGLLDGLGPIIGLILIIAVVFAFVRLFVVPALLVAGEGLSAARRQSARLTSGVGMTVGLLVLLYGLSVWALGSVPLVGTLLSGTVVAPIHAVTIVVLFELLSADEAADDCEPNRHQAYASNSRPNARK